MCAVEARVLRPGKELLCEAQDHDNKQTLHNYVPSTEISHSSFKYCSSGNVYHI